MKSANPCIEGIHWFCNNLIQFGDMERELRFQTKKFIQRLQFAITQKFFVAFLLMFSCGMMGQVTYIAPGTYTWTCPPNVTSIQVEAWGAGGAGGGVGTAALFRVAGGGGGGSYAQSSGIPVVPGNAYTIIVGAGGTGVSAAVGNAGGSSSFGSIVIATGGAGGLANNTAGSVSGGAGGSTATGSVSWNGGTGGTSNGTGTLTAASGGGGGGAGTTSNGGNANVNVAGTGGAVGGGSGGAGINTNTSTNGTSGNNPGGGGSGARGGSTNTSARLGGTGGSGKIILTYTGYCTPISTSTNYITSVLTTGASTNFTNTSASSNGYSNFFNTKQVIVTQGNNFTVSYVGGAGTTPTFGWAIWIDWNKNNVFDSSERVFVTTGYQNAGSSGAITVPIGQAPGDYVIRVFADYNLSNPSDPCGFSSASNGGEAEDYKLTVNALSATPLLNISGTTAHGSTCPGTATTSQTYTITNTGTSAANGITVVSSDPQFVVSGLSSTTIAGSGGTATYSVTFTPSSAGAKTATISVASSTSGSNSPTSNLTGTGTTTVTPIAVTSAATAVTAYTATLNATNGTTFGACPNTVQKGFVYSDTSVNSNPLNLGTGVINVPVTPIGVTLTSYSSNITGLIAGASYSYKAYLFDGTTYTYGPVQTFTTLTPPANDLCGNAQLLVVNAAAVPGTFVSSNFETPFTSGKDVWYKINPSCNGKFTIDLIATAGQPQIYLYAACGTATPLQATAGPSATKQLVTNSLSQGVDYFIRIMAGDTAAESATFTIAVNNQIAIVTQPANQTVAIGATASFGVSAPTNQTGRQWQVSTDNGFTWTDIPGATASPYVTPATTISMNGYRYRAVISNGTCYTITSNAATLTVTACASVPTSNDGLGITSVTMGTTTFAVADVTYLNYTGSVPTLNQGIANVSSITFATSFTYNTHIWIDFNDDGVFNNTTEKVYTGESTDINPTTLNTSFTLSATAALGSHRMRIGTADSGQSTPNPCYSGTFGVTIDLMVNIVVPPPPTTYTWTGTTNTSWGTATNWSPNGVPGTNDSVIISSPGTNGLIINGAQTITNFTLNGTGNFTMTSSGVLTINGNVTYGGTATASLNCASLVNITSSLPQVIPPLNYGSLNASGGDRNLLNGRTVGICFTFDPGTGAYTLDGSTVEYFSSAGYEFNMLAFTYHNLKFSGSDIFTIGNGNTLTVLGNFEQTAGTLNVAKSATANNFLNVIGDMTISGGLFNINVTDNGKGTVNLNGDLIVNGTGKLDATVNTDALLINTNFNFKGIGDGSTPATTQTISVDFPDNARNRRIRFNVKNGSYVRLLKDFDLGNKSVFNVETGGALHFGFNGLTALNITGNGRTGTGFTSQANSTLVITSPQGIMNTSGTVGNIQTNTAPSIAQDATFHYIGKQNQVTGDGLTLGSTVKNVFVNLLDNTTELRLTNKVGISNGGKLEIQKGILIAEEAGADDKDFYGTGQLVMSDGEYRISTITANPTTDFLPQLNKYASYSLTGGRVHLNGSNANQILSGIPVYKKLMFSGANTLGTNDKKISKALQVDEELLIKETAILNSENKGITGAANVKMESGRWQNAVISTTQPLLTGTYTLDGGTMEFYGSGANTNQTFRGDINYKNIDVKADSQNVNYSNLNEFYNVKASQSFVITGDLTVHSPAVFKISSTHHIDGTGSIFVNPGATLLYGSDLGLTVGTTGAVRLSGTHSFPADASYGFIGAGDMASGNGLPTAMINLYIAKSDAANNVTMSGNCIVKNKMHFLGGNVVTGSNTFQLGMDVANKGTLEYTSGFVKGTMSRWFDGANSGNQTSLFPLGTTDNKNRFANIEFTSTTAPGTITASVQNTAMGTVGISTLAAIPAVGTCATFSVFNTEEFYWNLTPVGIAGNYSAFFSKEQVGENPCEVTLLNRTATDWTAPGTHASATVALGIITTSRSGLNTFSDFGVGNKKCGLTKTWTGIWSGGTAPTITNRVVFAANYDSATQGGSVSACECEIQSGVTVTMAGGTTPHNMEIYNHLEGSGTLKLENNASLLQHSDAAVNIGKMEMTRNTQPAFRYDYTYWSSPVAAQSLHAVSPTTFFDKYYSWDASIPDWVLHQRPTPWVEAATPLPQNIMAPGKGYIIRAPQTFPVEAVGAVPQIFPAKFTGVPNNGLVSVPIVGGTDRFNLIGNPYPSAVSADEFLADASNTGVVEGTLYFWTHNTPIAQSGGTGMYNYSAADYAVYNGVGATSTVGGPAGVNNNSNIPNGFIASGQSFFIKGSATGGTAVFHNSMREKGSNDRFFRYASAEDLPAPTIEKHRIWLNMTNDVNGFSQSLIGYVADATNGYDRNFDGQVLGGGSVSLYSVLEGSKMTIQGRTLPFDQNDQVPMGFKATVAGSLKISIDHFDGLFAAQNIYLEDKALDIIHDLKAAPYIFTSAIGTFNERFILRYTNESLGTGEHAMDANDVIVAVKEKVIKVISAKENIKSITVFDLLGRTIYDNKAVNAMVFSTEEIMAQEQVLVVKIVLENNAKADRKIIFK